MDSVYVDIVLVVLGIALLYFGGDLLVDNAGALARSWGISSLVIGLTVVAFGTSAPELAASITAALSGSPELALGNVIGSNIANIALILALTALIYPLKTQKPFLRRELPVMIAAAALLPLLLLDGRLGRLDGGLFIVFLGGYLWTLLRRQTPAETQLPGQAAENLKSENPEPKNSEAKNLETENLEAENPALKSPWRGVLGMIAGLVLLVFGAQSLVNGATSLARGFGLSELVIGLTLVAVGTSLPELATAAAAALRREPDIALGNIVGSNIFNILFILGTTALLQPISVSYPTVALNLWLMLGLSLLLLPLLRTGMRLGRREGGVLLALYLGYVAYLYLM